VLGIGIALAMGSAPPAIGGQWITQDRAAVVRIAPCATGLCGRVTRILARGSDVPTTDVHNPDPRLRRRPLVGVQILSGFRQQGSGWTGGRVYDPKSGKAYKGNLALNSDHTLTVTGCVLFICRSQLWTRVGT
jgi:uncharacterized protein (DUF2147 family)